MAAGVEVVQAAGFSGPVPAPTTNTLPPGIPAWGPISADGVLTGERGVLPAVPQVSVLGVNSSVVGVSQVSTVSSCPLGMSVQPSSSLGSFLPCPENVSQL